MFEQDLPGENSAGFNKAGVTSSLPLETCLTMNQSWGYNASDDHFKSPEQIIQALVGSAGRGANLLLNVGPRPDGTIGAEFTERLLTVGRWLEDYGKSVYGTRRGPIPPQGWGVTTLRDGRQGEAPTIYLHVFKTGEVTLTLPEELVNSLATPFGKMTPLKLDVKDDAVQLQMPDDARTPYDSIIVVTPPTPFGPEAR